MLTSNISTAHKYAGGFEALIVKDEETNCGNGSKEWGRPLWAVRKDYCDKDKGLSQYLALVTSERLQRKQKF